MKRMFIILVSAAFTAGCGPLGSTFNTTGHYRAITAKVVNEEGCAARDVIIYKKPSWTGSPLGEYQWTADCNGRRYRCFNVPSERSKTFGIDYECHDIGEAYAR